MELGETRRVWIVEPVEDPLQAPEEEQPAELDAEPAPVRVPVPAGA